MITARRVVSPTEESLPDDFYLNRPGHDPVNMTALRQAERKFKGQDYLKYLKEEAVDFSKLDPLVLGEQYLQGYNFRLVGTVGHDGENNDVIMGLREGAGVWEMQDAPGFLIIPGAITPSQQRYWVQQSFSKFMRPPNECNLDALYDWMPSEGLYNCEDDLVRVRVKETGMDEVIPRLDLLKRVRWTTLGYQYDWTTKEYKWTHPIPDFPPNLSTWSCAVSFLAGFPAFRPEAGILNYYQSTDKLTSHVDRSEPNMTAPLLSLSLGSSCIFILGGAGREDVGVVPMVLKSGDVVVMAGESRSRFHGVPRIIPASCPAHLHDVPAIRHARLNLNIRQVTL